MREINGEVCLLPFIPINIAVYHALQRAGIQVRAFCDNSEKYAGKHYGGIPCLKPEEACLAFPGATMIISNLFSLYRNEIKKQLEKNGATRILMLEDILEPSDILPVLTDIDRKAASGLLRTNDIPRLAKIHRFYHMPPAKARVIVDFLSLYTDRDMDSDMEALAKGVDFIRVLRVFALPAPDMEARLLRLLERLNASRQKIGTVHIWRHPSAVYPLSLPSPAFWERVSVLHYDPQILNIPESDCPTLPHNNGIPCVFNQEQIYTDLFKAHQCIFVHIAKNSGTALREYLFGYTAEFYHSPARLYRNTDPNAYAEYFVFSMARNPWDRLVSGYTYCRSIYESRSVYDYCYNFCGNHSFKDFVRTLDTPKGAPLLDHVMITPQSRCICDETGGIMVDYVGRVEDSEDSYRYIAEKLHIDANKPIPHINASPRVSYREYYDDESREIVCRVFAKDIELFGYEF